jgi:hypothetical protein
VHLTVDSISAPAEVLAEHKHWNVLFYRLSERVLSEQHVLSEAHLLLHLPASPSPADTHARVRVYYVAIDKKTGKPTQFKVKMTKNQLTSVQWPKRELGSCGRSGAV